MHTSVVYVHSTNYAHSLITSLNPLLKKDNQKNPKESHTFLFVAVEEELLDTTEKNESSRPCVDPWRDFCNFLMPFRILSSLKTMQVRKAVRHCNMRSPSPASCLQ